MINLYIYWFCFLQSSICASPNISIYPPISIHETSYMYLYSPFNSSPIFLIFNQNNFKPTNKNTIFFWSLYTPPTTPIDLHIKNINNILHLVIFILLAWKIILITSILKHRQGEYHILWPTHKILESTVSWFLIEPNQLYPEYYFPPNNKLN